MLLIVSKILFLITEIIVELKKYIKEHFKDQYSHEMIIIELEMNLNTYKKFIWESPKFVFMK